MVCFFFILFSFKIFVFLFTFDPIHSISTPKCMCALFYHCKLIMSTVVWAMFTLFFWLCIHHGSYRFITDLFIYFSWFSTWDATNKYQFLNKTLQIFLVFFDAWHNTRIGFFSFSLRITFYYFIQFGIFFLNWISIFSIFNSISYICTPVMNGFHSMLLILKLLLLEFDYLHFKTKLKTLWLKNG